MLPVIAIVGRPNVGKSTLFNRLTRTRSALVADAPGLTRDRHYGSATLAERPVVLVDTGGIGEKTAGIDEVMEQQTRQAIAEADLVLFVVDGRSGISTGDEEIASELRRLNIPMLLAINKVDGIDIDQAMSDFYALGFSEICAISASQGRGIGSLSDSCIALLPARSDSEAVPDDAEDGIRVAVVGRPNVGKSTLVNRMLGEERVVVYDQPGTTRDSIHIPFERGDQRYVLIDTAGVRRRGRVHEAVEKFSVIKTIQAIHAAHVVILVCDASEGLVDQDLHLAADALEAGRALVLALNKWDGLEPRQRDRIKAEMDRRLGFVDFARKHFISALHGSGVGNLYGSVIESYQAAAGRWQTNKLTTMLQDAVQSHEPPLSRGRRIRLRYAHQGGSFPPLIVIHGNQTARIPATYQRYLENYFRKALKLSGSPLRLEFKTGENPYAGRRNVLTKRQQFKKKRLMKHVKRGR